MCISFQVYFDYGLLPIAYGPLALCLSAFGLQFKKKRLQKYKILIFAEFLNLFFMAEHFRYHRKERVLIFFIILLISGLIGVGISMVFASAGDMGIKIAQGLSSIMLFVVPPIVYYRVTRTRHPMESLGFRDVAKPSYLYIVIGVALMFISLPVTNQLTRWNEAMNFGGVFPQLEEYIKQLEEMAATVTEKMLKVDTFGGLLLNLLVIALIPAVGEELTFRGVLQQGLVRRMKSPHLAIILSAAIFSFIHFQFYGFLPRMFLGILLGYMFYITKSLWTSITMHFVNNGTAVVLYYLNNKGIIDIDPETFGSTQYLWLAIISLVVTAALIGWCWWKVENDTKKIR